MPLNNSQKHFDALMNAMHTGYLWTGTAEAVVSPFFLFF
jgi:hypothetical protein